MPSPAEEVARMFYVTEEETEVDERSGIVAFSVRSPAERLAHIDAMAAHASVSRNEMANELLRAGISAVLAALPDPIRDELYEAIVERISDL